MQNIICICIFEFELEGLITVTAEIKEDEYAVSKMIETGFSICLFCS